MSVTPEEIGIAPEEFDFESEGIGITVEGTEIIPAKQTSVSEKDIATLNNYADRKLQETTQLSEVMNTVPSIVQRGGIYLISAAVGLTSVLLYFSKVPVWIESTGNIVPKADNILIATAQPGVVTAVETKVGQRLTKGATLLEITPTLDDNAGTGDLQARTWQALQQKELEITKAKIELAQLQMQLAQTKNDAADAKNLVTLINKTRELEAEIDTITERENTLSSVAKNKVTMPQTGIVSQLNINKPGESINRDTVVATVVPDTSRLTVETAVSDRDMAAIELGMSARIKVDAYDFREFGTIPAEVSQIAPNLKRPGEFNVTLDLLENNLIHDGEEIDLLPGLNVQVEMQTERKRLLQMLFSKK